MMYFSRLQTLLVYVISLVKLYRYSTVWMIPVSECPASVVKLVCSPGVWSHARRMDGKTQYFTTFYRYMLGMKCILVYV